MICLGKGGSGLLVRRRTKTLSHTHTFFLSLSVTLKITTAGPTSPRRARGARRRTLVCWLVRVFACTFFFFFFFFSLSRARSFFSSFSHKKQKNKNPKTVRLPQPLPRARDPGIHRAAGPGLARKGRGAGRQGRGGRRSRGREGGEEGRGGGEEAAEDDDGRVKGAKSLSPFFGFSLSRTLTFF